MYVTPRRVTRHGLHDGYLYNKNNKALTRVNQQYRGRATARVHMAILRKIKLYASLVTLGNRAREVIIPMPTSIEKN